MNAIETYRLTKRYGPTTAVADASIIVPEGASHGFVGMNGAGKTTTIRMLCGRLFPSAGSARVCGVDPTEDHRTLARRIGVVFGENHIPEPEMSAARYLRHFASLYDIPKSSAERRMNDLFDALGLARYAGQPMRTLSGGNRRKVEIARALLHGPRLLLADEPTRELDIPTKHAVWDFLHQLKREEGLTIFLSSHDAAEIAAICSEVTLIRNGLIVWGGPIARLTGGGEPLEAVLSRRLQGIPTPFRA